MSAELRKNQINENPLDYDSLLEGSYYYYQPDVKYDKFRRVKLVSKSKKKTKKLYEDLKESLKPLLYSNVESDFNKANTIINGIDYLNQTTIQISNEDEGVGLQFVDDDTMIFINKSKDPKLYRATSGGKKNRKSKRNKSKRRRSSSRRKK